MAEGVFVRKASGLVREVGLTSGILFNAAAATQLTSCYTATPYLLMYGHSGNALLGLLIATIGSIFIASVYAHFTSAMPRSGGEYVFLSRTLHPALGFMVNWTMCSMFLFWYVFNNFFFADMTISTLSTASLPPESYAWLYLPLGRFAYGFVLMAIFALMAIIRMKWYVRMENIFWILGFIAVPIVFYGFVSSIGSFPAIFNKWSLTYLPNEPDMYNKILTDAANAGFVLNPPENPITLEQTMVFAQICLTWMAPFSLVTTYIAGEIKQANSTIRQHMLTIGAVLIWVLLWLLMAYPWIVSADIKFLAAFSYLGNVQGLPLSSFGWSWIQVVLPRSVALYYYIAAYLMQIVTVVPLVIITSRCILAWSFDRVFPTRLAHVSDRFSTPTYAVGALFGVGVVILFMAVWGNFWQWIAASSMWQLINICVVCFTGMIFPFVRKDLFEQMPTKIRVGGVPLLTIIAAIALFFGVWVGTAFFTNAKYFASLGITTSGIVGTICVYGLAAVVFLVSRAYWKRKGIDLTMAFRQIPPA